MVEFIAWPEGKLLPKAVAPPCSKWGRVRPTSALTTLLSTRPRVAVTTRNSACRRRLWNTASQTVAATTTAISITVEPRCVTRRASSTPSSSRRLYLLSSSATCWSRRVNGPLNTTSRSRKANGMAISANAATISVSRRPSRAFGSRRLPTSTISSPPSSDDPSRSRLKEEPTDPRAQRRRQTTICRALTCFDAGISQRLDGARQAVVLVGRRKNSRCAAR